ncbi:hypothetical protein SBDP1_1770007 [Syntrophobacter sp. SbD1]|nr:hypothetical protein SBDP1_1770007 [Syntrophobacter sp. SbD1]
MTIAIGLTFYSSHKKLWVCIEPGKKGETTIVTLAGKTNRNQHAFEEDFETLRATIEKRAVGPPAEFATQTFGGGKKNPPDQG